MISDKRSTRFTEVEYPEPHHDRARRILRAHPRIRDLAGRNPWSAVITLGIVALQLGIAYALQDEPVWIVLPVAWLVGALATHALWVLIHEATHGLVTAGPTGNRLVGILANLPMMVPSAESFRIYHLKHHKYQGDYLLDADLPSTWEARLVGRSPLRKLVWQILFPVLQSLRTLRFVRAGTISFFTRWVVANVLVVVAFDVAIVILLGPGAALYLVASLVFAVGPHPVGARWIQEHYLTFEGNQETGSYYGPLNSVALNVGYHNEHHDFPGVPWNRLPRVKAMVPEVYDSLESYRSWTRLWLRFLFDRSLTLFCRVTRDGRANVRSIATAPRGKARAAAVRRPSAEG